jgi:hypothetical protein
MKPTLHYMWAMAVLLTVSVGGSSLLAQETPLDLAKANVEKAAAMKAEAEKAAAEKAATAKTTADSAAAADAAAKAATAAKAAAEQAVKTAEAMVAAAKIAQAEKEAADKAAAEQAAATKAAAEKAAAEKAAADKLLAEQVTAANNASAALVSEEAYHAKLAAEKAATDKANAEKVLAQKAAAAKTATDQAAAAKNVADKAAADKTAAEAALAAAADADKPALQAALDEKTAAAKTAADAATAAQTAADQATAESQAAQQAVTDSVAAIVVAQEKAAATHATALGGLKPIPAAAWDYAKARHLLVRAGFGGTPDEVQNLYAMGLHNAVNYMVDIYERPTANLEFDPLRLERPEPWESRLNTDEQTELNNRRINRERQQQAEMRRWWLQRMAESPRPLQEKLTLFWHDHFATQYEKLYRTYMLYQQNQLFRTYGCDNYAALLRGIAHDPATIAYLDNNVNFKGSGNENLGREILELFSLGEGQGYTEEDLREASRCLTGYNYDYWNEQFRFIATRFDETPKKVFGQTGNWGGDELVDLILQQPATAKYTVQKLFIFFAYEDPEPVVVDQLAHVLRTSGYDLRPMLKNLFLSEQFYSERAMGTHIKGPVELAVGAIRDLGIKNVNYAVVDSAVIQMGQYLYEPPNVAGWNENRAWVNAELILTRYNQIANLVEQPNVDVVALLEGKGLQTPLDIVNHLAKTCLVVQPSEEKCHDLAAFLGDLPPAAEWGANREAINAKLRAVLALMMSTPESQVG